MMRSQLNNKVFFGLSSRADGSMAWRNTVPIDEQIRNNQERYFNVIGIKIKDVVFGGLAHDNNVTVIEDNLENYILNSDALITNKNNIVLAVTAADCLPVYFFDSLTNSIGIAHAGWKGLVAGILENTVLKLRESFSVEPKDLQVIIGPHIKSCHFEVGPEIKDKFLSNCLIQKAEKYYIDLGLEAKQRLINAGIKNVAVSDHCTYCESDKFYSARHDNCSPVKSMVAYIGLS